MINSFKSLVTFLLGCTVSANSYAQNVLTPPEVYRTSPTGINLQDGRFVYQTIDLSIGSLSFERSLLTGDLIQASAFFGDAWTHNYDAYVVFNCPANKPCASVVIGRRTYKFDRTGSAGSFMFTGSGAAKGMRLLYDGTSYRFYERDGTAYLFSPNYRAYAGAGQRLVSITSPNGSITTISYNGASQPKVISINAGFAIVLDYESHGYVSAACGFNLTQTEVTISTTCAAAVMKTSYSYTVAGNRTFLSGFRNVSGQVAQVGDTNSFFTSSGCIIRMPSGLCRTAFANTVGSMAQTMGDGAVWNFVLRGEYGPGADTSENSVIITDPRNGTIQFAVEPQSEPLQVNYRVVDQLNRTTIAETYDGDDLTIIKPEGDKVQPNRNSRYLPAGATFIPKPGSGLSNITQGASTFPEDTFSYYPCSNMATCNRPLTVADGKGNQVTYTYDQTHGGVLTETAPATGGIAPQKRYDYVQRSAWIKTGGAGYGPAAPIWLVSTMRYCRTSAAAGNGCSAGPSDEVVTSYDYGPDSGPNNLFLRGTVVTADGVSLRTCYRYDWMGNKIAETSPRAGLTSCA